MNPVRRRRRRSSRRRLYGAALKAHQRRIGRGSRKSRPRRRVRHRRVRRNPVGRGHSTAMRSKISRAVKASFRRRRGGVTTRAVSRVRRSFSFARPRRRRGGGGGGGLSFANPLKAMFSRSTLTMAGGAVASSFLTQFVLTRFGAQLPMSNQVYGRVAYKLLIPIAGAALTKRFNRDLASGMLVGGAVMAINELIAQWAAPKGGPTVAAMKAYGQEYDGEADFATDTYMADVATGMPETLSQAEDLAEYFEGDNPFDSAPAFKNEF